MTRSSFPRRRESRFFEDFLDPRLRGGDGLGPVIQTIMSPGLIMNHVYLFALESRNPKTPDDWIPGQARNDVERFLQGDHVNRRWTKMCS
jgi:hypothetical protein